MKTILYVISVALVIMGTGCKSEMRKAAVAAGQETEQKAGTVVEYINAGNYTYVHVDTGTEKVWAAAPAFQVKVGDHVVVPTNMPMKNYRSESLGRTFNVVYFAGSIPGAGSKDAGSQLPAGHPQITASDNRAAAAPIDLSGIAKLKGGKTVAEVHNEKTNLSGKEVAVRGKVVKYNSGILGKNWIHLRDGTGAEGTNDLTVTTDGESKVGDTVVARGVLATDKDFGSGYKYAVVLENARIAVE
ncbi:MAG: hypothetical protein HY695_00810 [Deltaproteobacteria bacterium]|nr:hypothetical protein [Deltaproteobacteria bacterium]